MAKILTEENPIYQYPHHLKQEAASSLVVPGLLQGFPDVEQEGDKGQDFQWR